MNRDVLTTNQEIEIETKRLDDLHGQEVPLGEKMAAAQRDFERAVGRLAVDSEITGLRGVEAEKVLRSKAADLKYEWTLAEVVYKSNIRAQENSRTKLTGLYGKRKHIE
jgi:hypothetical protein